MEYHITIIKRSPNPEFSPKRSPYDPEQMQYLGERVLETVLTEEEFKKIRDEVLKNF